MNLVVFEWKVVSLGRQSSSKNGQGQVRNEDAGLYVLCWMHVGARSVHRFWTRAEREVSLGTSRRVQRDGRSTMRDVVWKGQEGSTGVVFW